MVHESKEKLVCTVRVAVTGGDPEFHQVEVFDTSNAIPMLKNRLATEHRYNWDLAKVIEAVPR